MGAVTTEQARQIQELRVLGKGYKAIALATGLSRETVRYHCKRIDTEAQAAPDSIAAEDLCPCCGKPIAQPRTGRKRKFCSEACRRSWWTTNQDSLQRRDAAMYPKTCAHCGQEFLSYGNDGRRYCSRSCYVHDRFRS